MEFMSVGADRGNSYKGIGKGKAEMAEQGPEGERNAAEGIAGEAGSRWNDKGGGRASDGWRERLAVKLKVAAAKGRPNGLRGKLRGVADSSVNGKVTDRGSGIGNTGLECGEDGKMDGNRRK